MARLAIDWLVTKQVVKEELNVQLAIFWLEVRRVSHYATRATCWLKKWSLIINIKATIAVQNHNRLIQKERLIHEERDKKKSPSRDSNPESSD